MNDPLSAIPWHTPALWQEANASLKHILQYNGPAWMNPVAWRID